MPKHRVVLLAGDGIGPEVSECARRVIEAAGLPVEWIEMPIGLEAFQKYGDALPATTLAAIKSCGTALKGPTTTPIGKGHASANVRLRNGLTRRKTTRRTKTKPLHTLGRLSMEVLPGQ